MHESITIADVGSIVKVSGRRIATPFGPPNPGSTPTKMPSTRPTSISDSVFHVSRTAKPWRRSARASILIAEERFDRSLRHDDVERQVERGKHGEREQETREQRFPPRDSANYAHEAGDQQEARDVEAKPLREQAEQKGWHEHLQHTPKLGAGNECLVLVPALQERDAEAVQRRTAEDDAEIEWQVSGLRAVAGPPRPTPPII